MKNQLFRKAAIEAVNHIKNVRMKSVTANRLISHLKKESRCNKLKNQFNSRIKNQLMTCCVYYSANVLLMIISRLQEMKKN